MAINFAAMLLAAEKKDAKDDWPLFKPWQKNIDSPVPRLLLDTELTSSLPLMRECQDKEGLGQKKISSP